jgi:glycosyltransferase involved in cell wall biosynthesis
VVAPGVIWLASKLLGYKFVIDAHSGVFHHLRWIWSAPIQRFLGRRAEATIVTNSHMADIVQSWGGEARIVQDISLNLDPSGPAERKSKFHVVYICTYSVDEPVEEVVEAARRMPDVLFSLSGDPSYARRGFKSSLPPNVQLAGFLPDSAYLALLRGADAILVLTRDDNTMQRGAYEAMALEKPLITSRWPLLQEVFYRGTVHVNNSATEIVGAVDNLRSHLLEYQREMAKLRTERALVSAAQVASLEKLCQQALEGRRG